MNVSPAKTPVRAPASLMRRLLGVAWPFLLTIGGCMWLALLSMELMSAARAYVGGESLWSKEQKNAVLHLGEYALTCDPRDFSDYEAALAVPKGDRIARRALSQPNPDLVRAREGFLQGQNHPSDIDGMIMLFRRFGQVSFMREAIDIWARADDMIDELDVAAQALRTVVEGNCRDEPGKQRAMATVLAINERLTPLQRAFSDTVGHANRMVHLLTGGALLAIAALLTALGVWRSVRVLGRHAQDEQRLADSEERFQLAVAGSRQGLWDLDAVNGDLFVSPELELLLDMPVGSFGTHRHDFIRRLHPDERDDAVRQLNILIAQGQSFEMELRLRDGLGQYRWVRTAGRARLGASGEAVRVLGSIHDISARKALETALQDQTRSREAAIEELLRLLERHVTTEARSAGTPSAEVDTLAQVSRWVGRLVEELQQRGEHLNAIFALSPDGFVSFDAAYRINHVNTAFTRLTGLSEAQAMGLHEHQLQRWLQAQMADDHTMPSLAALRESAMSGAEGVGLLPRFELARPARRVIELQWRLGSHESISQVLYLHDVTHETEVERMKSEFLSTAAHELRTPMASIIGFSELLMMRSYPAQRQTEMLQTVHRQAGRMARIVDELLDLARIEARRGQDFTIQRLDLNELVTQGVGDFGIPNERSRPLWNPTDAPVWVAVDRGKLLQALGNVLSNAYKYSPDGGDVEVALVPSGATAVATARPMVGIQVTDHGIGMLPEQVARMGERFYRADTSGRIPGTGLGVSIVQEILHLLGGRIEFKSTAGQGTQVTLWLPLAA